MKKKLLMLLLPAVMLFNLFIFVACNNDNPEGPEVTEPEKITYEDLYSNEAVKSEPITGAALYKASYGYTLSEVQGYNAFYYQNVKDGNYLDMVAEDGKWKGEGASMDDGMMTAVTGVGAVRTFIAPADGKAHVYGNPYLADGTTATVSVYLDGSEILRSTVSDDTGIYHSDEITLKKGQALRFVVEGDSTVYWNPTVDYTLAEETSLHHAVDGYYGDVHPFYDAKTKKMYMYYLSTGMQSEQVTERFASLLSTSGNMVQYESTPLKMDEKNPPEQDLYFALGVYIDKDGNYRSSYGKGNYAGGSVSTDLVTWSNGAEPYVDENDGFLKYTFRAYFDTDVTSGRDPDIFYDKESGKYYCVVMNYYTPGAANGAKSLALYIAGEDGRFSTKATKLVDFTGRGDPECPQLKKMGDTWYLFYSVYGTGTAGNVGCLSYRIGDPGVTPDKVDWNSKKEYTLDGGDLHAAQLCQVGDMWYMYGWLNYTPHASVWGGYLNLAREVYVKPDGTLGSRCDSYLTSLLNMGRVAEFGANNTELSGMSVEDGKFTATGSQATATLQGNYGRSLLFAHIDLPLNAKRAGYTIKSNGYTYFVGVQRSIDKLYLIVSDNPDNYTAGCKVEILDANTTSFDLKIVADGNFIEAFVNDEYSVSANTRLGANYEFALSAFGSGAVISGAEVCKLADYYNIFD